MAVSATIINMDELEIKFPPHLMDIPVSFQRVYHDYWEPIIARLELPTLCYIGVLDVGFTMWPVVKDELLQIREFIKKNPDIVDIELNKNAQDKNISEYMLGRIDHLIETMQEAYVLSEKVIYNI